MEEQPLFPQRLLRLTLSVCHGFDVRGPLGRTTIHEYVKLKMKSDRRGTPYSVEYVISKASALVVWCIGTDNSAPIR